MLFILVALFTLVVLVVNGLGAILAVRTGWSYGWWLPVTIGTYVCLGYLGSSVASVGQVALAAFVAGIPDGTIGSWFAWRIGAVPMFEDEVAARRGIAASLPIVVALNTTCSFGGAFLATVLGQGP